jgi:hypothetical protein
MVSIPIISKLHHCFRVGPVTVCYQEQSFARLFHVKEYIRKIWIELDVPENAKNVGSAASPSYTQELKTGQKRRYAM